MTEKSQYHLKYEEVYAYGTGFVVFLIGMIYSLIGSFTSQTDKLHYHLMFAFFTLLLTTAFAWRTYLAWKTVSFNESIDAFNQRISKDGLPLEDKRLF